MTSKTKHNILALIFALLIFFSLVFAFSGIWGAALGTAFFAFLIWNNKLRKKNESVNNETDNNNNKDNNPDNSNI